MSPTADDEDDENRDVRVCMPVDCCFGDALSA